MNPSLEYGSQVRTSTNGPHISHVSKNKGHYDAKMPCLHAMNPPMLWGCQGGVAKAMHPSLEYGSQVSASLDPRMPCLHTKNPQTLLLGIHLRLVDATV